MYCGEKHTLDFSLDAGFIYPDAGFVCVRNRIETPSWLVDVTICDVGGSLFLGGEDVGVVEVDVDVSVGDLSFLFLLKKLETAWIKLFLRSGSFWRRSLILSHFDKGIGGLWVHFSSLDKRFGSDVKSSDLRAVFGSLNAANEMSFTLFDVFNCRLFIDNWVVEPPLAICDFVTRSWSSTWYLLRSCCFSSGLKPARWKTVDYLEFDGG